MIVIDIETDNLLRNATTLHTVCAYDGELQKYLVSISKNSLSKEEIYNSDLPLDKIKFMTHEALLNHIQNADKVIAHNGVQFDFPCLNKLYPWFKLDIPNQVEDTLIMSRMYYPDQDGHSIKYYGDRFGFPKGDHTDWSKVSIDMLRYCIRDVDIGVKVWEMLNNNEFIDDWRKSLNIEYLIADVQTRQELHGVGFDQDIAYNVAEELFKKIQETDEELLEQLPLRVIKGSEVSKPFKKDGTHSKIVQDYFQNSYTDVSGPFCRVYFEEFNLNSHDQIKNYLLKEGWIPDEWNYKKDDNGRVIKDEDGEPIKTAPKITDSSLETVSGTVGKKLGERSVLRHRLSMIFNIKTDGKLSGWLNTVREDGRLEAGAIPCATNTGRARHFGIVNVPSVNSFYGKELRSMITATDGKILLGADVKSLEAVVLVHFVKQEKDSDGVAELLTNGPHDHNAAMWGVKRNVAKSGLYAILYGCQPTKLATTLGCDMTTANRIYDSFWEFYKPVKNLKDRLEKAYKSRKSKSKSGYILGIDGRKLHARSPHSLLNLLIQATGSVLVKAALVLIDKEIAKNNLDAVQCIFMHDEAQYIVAEKDVDKLTEIIHNAFYRTSKHFNLNVMLEVDVKTGKNWADTH